MLRTISLLVASLTQVDAYPSTYKGVKYDTDPNNLSIEGNPLTQEQIDWNKNKNTKCWKNMGWTNPNHEDGMELPHYAQLNLCIDHRKSTCCTQNQEDGLDVNFAQKLFPDVCVNWDPMG